MAIPTLVFAGGSIHDWKGCGASIRQTLEASGEFDITYVEDDLDVFCRPGFLDPFELLVFYYTVGDITDAQKNGLLNWVASGKGFVGSHSAADSFRGSPEYRALVGGYFVTHPHYRSYQVSVLDHEHPIMAGLGDEFQVTDEQYIMAWDRRNHVLANALWKGDTMPVAWTKEWGAGRVFYLALGHDPAACEQEVYQTLLVRGARWAATKPEG
ncbi:MAG: ThuA domain-containing protein [Armatimonadetes bacterium]|nr:ThuA domain-containing protein [Armatimonadota bacterium]